MNVALDFIRRNIHHAILISVFLHFPFFSLILGVVVSNVVAIMSMFVITLTHTFIFAVHE